MDSTLLRACIALLLVGVLSGCATPSIEARHAGVEKIAQDAGWRPLSLDVGAFVLAAFVPTHLTKTDRLTVYIEGDGLAWLAPETPSLDPTPIDPLALKLAIRDRSHRAVYLARPCQYVTGENRRNCTNSFWTDHRFAPVVITAENRAINLLCQRYGAQKLVLMGYSGGGAVAALVSARRNDVSRLVTVAGNLDTTLWVAKKHLSPLHGSMNPADAWRSLLGIPQVHFVGGRDKIMGPEFAEAYRNRFPLGRRPKVVVIPSFNHHCCWVKVWPQLVGY